MSTGIWHLREALPDSDAAIKKARYRLKKCGSSQHCQNAREGKRGYQYDILTEAAARVDPEVLARRERKQAAESAARRARFGIT